MPGVYTLRYGDARRSATAFREAGLDVAYVEHLFGCATGVVGVKPG